MGKAVLLGWSCGSRLDGSDVIDGGGIGLNNLNLARAESTEKMWGDLRRSGLNQTAKILWGLTEPEPALIGKFLPRMASEEVQKSWTGASGETLMRQSVDFLRVVSERYAWFTGSSLQGKKILDYGCGYGRLLRLLPFFTNIENIYGVDPWEKAIELCVQDGVPGNLSTIPYLPSSPIGNDRFDLIFAFSVFTHTSERATRAGLLTMLESLTPGGVGVITIRPRNYWTICPNAVSLGQVAQLETEYDSSGFSFLPHLREAVDGDVTYGDTVVAAEWLERNIEGLEILGTDISSSDTHQQYLFFQAQKD